MKNQILLPMTAVALFMAVPMAAHATDSAAGDASAVQKTEPAAGAQQVQLEDGTQVYVSGKDVSVIDESGNHAPAPDGEHTLPDGTTFKTKDGQIIQ